MAPSPADLVREFHELFGLPLADRPACPDAAAVGQRQRLLDEEVAELVEAVAAGDVVGVARELADVVYVLYGTALTYGIDLDAVLAEVHRANLSKLGPDGLPVVRDGKIIKPEGFRPPRVATALGLARPE